MILTYICIYIYMCTHIFEYVYIYINQYSWISLYIIVDTPAASHEFIYVVLRAMSAHQFLARNPEPIWAVMMHAFSCTFSM